jgi:hypothetical protein
LLIVDIPQRPLGHLGLVISKVLIFKSPFFGSCKNKLPVAIPESHHAKPVIRPFTAESLNLFDG